MSDLGDALDDAAAAAEYRTGRTAPPTGGPRVHWNQGKTIEVEGLVIEVGQSAERALLQFLETAMGEDSDLTDALDLSKMSLSIMYDGDGGRRLAWVKCPVDTDKLRDPRLKAVAQQYVEAISKAKPKKAPKPITGPSTDDLWLPGDLQLGKAAEAFGGLKATENRIGWMIDETLPAYSKGAARIVIGAPGDTTEGCQGSYDNQPYKIVLNSAEQFASALGIFRRMIDRALELAPEVVLTGVSSNHDQNSRGNGKKNVTDHWDDRWWMLMTSLQLAYSMRDDGERVTFLWPEDPLVTAFQMRDLVVALTHGHEIGGSGEAVVKVNNWWKGQIASRRGAAAAAHVLVCGHHHHYFELRDGARLTIGTPALDGGSGYLKDAKGVWAMPGMVTLKVDDLGVKSTDLHTWPQDRIRARELGVLAA